MRAWISRIQKWFNARRSKLHEWVAGGVVSGIVRAVVQFLADQLGWPAAISTIILLGGAAAIDQIFAIPSEWVWFATLALGVFLIPRTISAQADLRRASATEINAATERLHARTPQRKVCQCAVSQVVLFRPDFIDGQLLCVCCFL